jgi:hypothetical protein
MGRSKAGLVHRFVHETRRDGLRRERCGRTGTNTRRTSAEVRDVDERPPETPETAVVWLITQRSQVSGLYVQRLRSVRLRLAALMRAGAVLEPPDADGLPGVPGVIRFGVASQCVSADLTRDKLDAAFAGQSGAWRGGAVWGGGVTGLRVH